MVTNYFFQLAIFGDFSDITATPDVSIRALDSLREFSLLPNTFSEITPPNPVPVTRLRFSSVQNEWSVNIGVSRIFIEQSLFDTQTSQMEIESFSQQSVGMLEKLLSEFNKTGTRISFVANGLLREMSPEELQNAYIRLVRPIEFYANTPPFEWSVRSASRVDYLVLDTTETVNLITTVGRVHGTMRRANVMVGLDRLSLNFDINTIPENRNSRMSIESVRSFLSQAIHSQNTLIAQVEDLLHE